MFVDRVDELEFLKSSLSKPDPQLLVLYGRRRVGKTSLVNQYLGEQNNFSDNVYFLADERGTKQNIDRFAEETANSLDDIKPDAEGFEDVFEYISRRTDSCLVVLDEFSYLVEKDEAVPSMFQYIWDEIVKDDMDCRFSLILLGSSISMMEEGVLSYESPLYGRRTGQWKLQPLSFRHTMEFFAGYTFEDQIRVYSALGGIPAYLEKFEDDTGLFENIEKHVLSKGSFLYEEPEFLLRQELREPATYMGILKSMASGSTTVTEIANDIGKNASGMSRYLKNLQELELVRRITPVTERSKSRAIYMISDNFLRFWFRFVYPMINSLERGATTECRSAVEAEIDKYVSHVFEDICMQAIYEDGFSFDPTNVGRWWYKENEVDIIAINEERNEILLGECKWTNSPVDTTLLKDLRDITDKIRWRNDIRTEKYVLFSKSGFSEILRDEAVDQEDVLLYNLDDLELVFHKGGS